ncbi:hypothetical protein J437_LFUL010218 [Ladona fulva]|uniref:Uncharacterized protein n=1 Tax=Ladona fulva TaxID=123851 RepID=A0A8K0K8N4_LADFU|nr:hypothetical protein J437_LFUL010218 [Ladona fulva]
MTGLSVESGKEAVSSGICVDLGGSARTSYTRHDVENRKKQNRQVDDSECAPSSGSEDNTYRTASLRDTLLDSVVSGSSSILGVPSKDIVLPQEPSPCLLLQILSYPISSLFRVSGSVDGVENPVDQDGVISVGDVDSLDVSVSGVGSQNSNHLDPHQVLVPGVLGTAGFQVLLLSPPLESPRNHDFPPESTINLRDLE